MIAGKMILGLWGCAAAACQATAMSPTPLKVERPVALDGQGAAAAVECIARASVRSTKIVPGVGVLFDTGGTIYLNQLSAGGHSLRENSILVMDLPFPNLCRDDVVSFDNGSIGLPDGIIYLGEFVPYSGSQGTSPTDVQAPASRGDGQ